jgi:hypothetical protein
MAKTLLLLAVLCFGTLALMGCGDGVNDKDYGGEVKKVDDERAANFKGRFSPDAGKGGGGGKDLSAVSVDR